MATLTKEQETIIKALTADLRQSYGDITLEYVREQAEKVLDGGRVRTGEVNGVPGLQIERCFTQLGWIE